MTVKDPDARAMEYAAVADEARRRWMLAEARVTELEAALDGIVLYAKTHEIGPVERLALFALRGRKAA